MQIRAERVTDIEAIYQVNVAAFETPGEAILVNALRTNVAPIISLVAEADEKVVGHILFSPVVLEEHGEYRIMGLAPMSVSPERQNTGIGSQLVAAGLEQCKQLGISAVVVLGHPEYYPRFGFTCASTFGITSEYAVPDEVFMALELVPDTLLKLSGAIRYHDAFKNV